MGWMRIDRVTWGERALWAAFVVGSVAPVALQPQPEDLALAYVAAINRGDVEAAMDLTDTDFVLHPHLSSYTYGREAARGVLEWRAALRERWRVVSWDYEPAQGEVQAVVEITNDAWLLAGARPVVEVVLVARNGALTEERAGKETPQLRETLQPFVDWSRTNRPEELARTWRNGHFLRGAHSAELLLRLMREWRAAGEPVAADPERGQP